MKRKELAEMEMKRKRNAIAFQESVVGAIPDYLDRMTLEEEAAQDALVKVETLKLEYMKQELDGFDSKEEEEVFKAKINLARKEFELAEARLQKVRAAEKEKKKNQGKVIYNDVDFY